MFRILRHGNNSIEGNYVCGALMVRVDMRNITGVTLVRHPGWSTLILLICSVWLTGLGLYFMFFRPALLPEDLRYLGGTLAEVYAAAPGLVPWLRRVFTSWVDSCRQRGFLRDGSSWTRRGAAEGQLESFSL